jgi:hypothetical protein
VIARLRTTPRLLALLLALATIQAVAWAVVLPPLQGPDEVSHFTYTQRIVERGQIPWHFGPQYNPNLYPYSAEVEVAEGVAGFGPLAGNVAARPYWTRADVTDWSHADAALGSGARTGGGFTSAFDNPPVYYLYEVVPYAVAHGGSFFDRAELMRLWNIPLLLVALVFVWLLAGELLGRGWPQVVATATVPLLPQLTNVTATINPDIMLVAEWSVALYLMVLVLRRGPQPKLVLLLGALCAVAALTHARNLPIFVPAVAAVAIALARERRITWLSPWRICVGSFAVYGLAVLALAERGPKGHAREFVSYLWQFYLPKLGFMTTAIGPPGYRFRQAVPDRLFGTLAQLEVVLPHDIETAMYWISLAALVAVIVALIARRDAVRRNSDVAWVLGLAIVALVLGDHLGAYRGLTAQPNDPVFTARYLLPLLPLFGVAIALIVGTLPRRLGALLFGLVLGVGVCLQAESLYLLVERFYA